VLVSSDAAAANCRADDFATCSHLEWNSEPASSAAIAAESATAALADENVQGAIVISSSAAHVACLANRNLQVRAAVAASTKDVHHLSRSMGANMYCIDPSGLSRFELQNVLRAIGTSATTTAPLGWKE
jgi:ribose 5-phosphate isomerase RpiB